YGCWMKGIREIYIAPASQNYALSTKGVSHTLIANNYIASNGAGNNLAVQWGYENDTIFADSDLLFLNNIVQGGFAESGGGNNGMVFAYNYFYDTCAGCPGGSWAENGEFSHNPGGQFFLLREGNQVGIGWDDDTWTTHNFDTWFRNWDS